MSAQHQKWANLVKERLAEKKWTQSDLAQAVGLDSPGTISDLLKKGKGSVELKLKVSKLLGIREPWEKFVEQENETKTISVYWAKKAPTKSGKR